MRTELKPSSPLWNVIYFLEDAERVRTEYKPGSERENDLCFLIKGPVAWHCLAARGRDGSLRHASATGADWTIVCGSGD